MTNFTFTGTVSIPPERPDFRIITGQPVQGMVKQRGIGGGIVGPGDFIGDHHIRGEPSGMPILLPLI